MKTKAEWKTARDRGVYAAAKTMPATQIAEDYAITRQRVYQIIAEQVIKAKARKRPRKAAESLQTHL